MIRFLEKRKIIRKPTKNIVVLYHADCTDGFSAAWAAWKKFGDKADYIGIDPGTKPISGLKGKEIYMVDLIYPVQYLKKLISENKKFVAIDHHVSNQEASKLVPDGLFDISHSGAVLSWKYFHPKIKVPRFFEYVEDMDLWKFKLPKTKEIISYLDMFDFSFPKWNEISNGIETKSKFNKYVEVGSLLLKYQDRVIERIISNHANLVNFLGYKTYAVNSPIFNSQIANVLSKKLPPMGIVWVQESNGSVHISLRSDGTVDVSKLAAKFNGGGGHKRSAGFNVKNCSELPWKKLKS
ncbi:MAG: DHHA1 domain-containing protein [Candidatus Paceibacterota bacterium]